MGKTLNGILAGTSGKVGPVVVAKGQGDEDIVRIKPSKTTKLPKQSQLDQRSIFSKVTAFTTQTQSVMNIGYQAFQKEVKPLNAANQYLLKNAVTGTTPLNFKLDLTKVKISKENGGLQLVDVAMVSTVAAKLTLSWDFNAEEYNAAELIKRGLDQGVILLYNEATGYSFTRTDNVLRSAGTVTITVSKSFTGVPVHVWMFFAAVDGQVSPTQYLKTITILAK